MADEQSRGSSGKQSIDSFLQQTQADGDVKSQVAHHVTLIKLKESSDPDQIKSLQIDKGQWKGIIRECGIVESVSSLMLETANPNIRTLCGAVLQIVQQIGTEVGEVVDWQTLLQPLIQLLFNQDEEISEIGKQQLLKAVGMKPEALKGLVDLFDQTAEVLDSEYPPSTTPTNTVTHKFPQIVLLNILQVVHMLLVNREESSRRSLNLLRVCSRVKEYELPRPIKNIIGAILLILQNDNEQNNQDYYQRQYIETNRRISQLENNLRIAESAQRQAEEAARLAEHRAQIAEEQKNDIELNMRAVAEQNRIRDDQLLRLQQENAQRLRQNERLPLLSLEEEQRYHLYCELTNQIMTDPVSVDGHYYERAELIIHIREFGLHPATYEMIQIRDIQEEPQLKEWIARYLRDNPQRRPVHIPGIALLTAQEETRQHFICELTNQIMTDPVSLDGQHYFERAELVKHIEEQGISPVTYEAVSINDIKEEPELKAKIQRYLRDNPQRRPVHIPRIALLTAQEETRQHFICELTNQIMTDPVSLDGQHYFERAQLVRFIEEQGISPVTYEAVSINDIKEEPELKARIQRYLRDNPQRRLHQVPNQHREVPPNNPAPPRAANGIPCDICGRQIPFSGFMDHMVEHQRVNIERGIGRMGSGNNMNEEQIKRLPHFKYKAKGGEEDQCVICLTAFKDGDEVLALNCLHKFHPACITPWILQKHTCPICKT